MKTTACLLASACIMHGALASSTYYVATNGVDIPLSADPEAGSADKPFRTIQFAVDEAADGDVVKVRPGVYDSGYHVDSKGQTNRVYISKNLRLESTGGAAVTHIVGKKDPSSATGLGTAAVRCVFVEKNNVSGVAVSGFTIRDGATFDGSADGRTTSGGGVCHMYADEPGAVLNECVVSNNVAAFGGGVRGGVLTRCLLAGNHASYSGSAAYGGRFYNCVVTRNSGDTSKTHAALRNPKVVAHCTIVFNGVRGAYAGTDNRYLYNSVVAGNNGGTYYGFTTVAGCSTGTSAMFGVVSTFDDWRVVSGSPIATAASADYLAPFDLRTTGFTKTVPDAVVAEFMQKDFYGKPMPTAEEIESGAALCAGASQEIVVPAGGAVYFPKATGCGFIVDGCPATFGFWAYPVSYPRQYRVRAAPNAGYCVLQLKQTPDTAAFGLLIPNDRDEFAVIAPPTDGLVVTNTVSCRAVSNQAWVDCVNGSDETGAVNDETKPFASIQAAVDAAAWGAFINVLPGVYSNNTSTLYNAPCRVACTSAKCVYIQSTHGAEKTVILGGPDPSTGGSGTGAIRCVALQDQNFIRGFTLAQGGCNTSGSYSAQGSAFFANDEKGCLIDCIISNTVVESGYPVAGGTLTRCRILGNSSASYICSGTTLNACLVAGNIAGGAVVNSASKVVNCTFADNAGGAEFYTASDGTTTKVVNSIAASGEIAAHGGSFAGSILWAYPSLAATSGAAVADPLFPGDGDYRPLASSPAYTHGGDLSADDPGDVWRGVNLDIDGNPVAISDSGRVAAGAYSTPNAQALVRIGADNAGLSVTGGCVGWNLLADGTQIELRPQAGSRPCAGVIVNGVTNLFAETLPVVLTAEQASAAGGLVVAALYTSDWYVDDDGAAGNTGMSPNDAKNSFAELFATGAVVAGDTVHVLPGTYSEGSMLHDDSKEIRSRLVVPAGVTVRSTDGAEATVIVGKTATTPETYKTSTACGCGAGAERCVYLNSGAKLIGFTVTGGRTRCSLDVDMHYNHDAIGGGILGPGYDNADSPTTYAADCIISNNAAFRGGGARNVTLVNCRILNNRGYYGGSAASDSSLLACLVKGNRDYTYNRPVFTFSKVKNCTLFDHIQNPASANTSRISCSYLHLWYTNGRSVYDRCVFREESEAVADEIDAASVIAPESELVFDDEGRPVVGCNALIDALDVSSLPAAAAGHDASGGPRVTNGALDIGALEADWTERYESDLGRRATLTAVTGTVRDPGTGTIGLYDGSIAFSWEHRTPGQKAFLVLEAKGAGELVVSVNGEETARLDAADGKTTVAFTSGNAADDICVVYIPAETDDIDPATAAEPCAVVYGVRTHTGLMFIVR